MTSWLIAWLWQGTALALGISASFRLLPRVNATTRYLIWWCAAGVLAWLGWSWSPHISPLASVLANADAQTTAPSLFEIAPMPEWLMTSVMMLWATVALFKLLRVLSGLHALYRFRDSCGPVLQTIEARLPLWLDAKKHGRPVQLMICDSLPNAAVLGLHQPYIALPSRLLAMASADELDQIVLHEYGHVQRWDDWTRLAQALFDAALWMHPAARWIGSALNLEREVACDDWVVSRTRAARAYAGCLSRVAQHNQVPVSPRLAPALFGKTPDVLLRVDRLLNPRRNANRRLSLTTAAAGICLISVSAAHLRALPLVGEFSAGLSIPDPPRLVAAAIRVVSAPEVPAATETITAVAPAPRVGPREGSEAALSDVMPMAVPFLAQHSQTSTFDPAEMVSIDSRSFHTVYAPPRVSAQERTAPSPRGWQFGAAIGKATKKASLVVGGSVAKVGISIAKSF
jgi:beta-lactamase regulating signal transducer with metallopeptidase domain